MAALDDILKANTGGENKASLPIQLAQKAMSGVSASPANVATEQKEDSADNVKVGGYEELFKQLNPYTPPSAEELEKERKKQKRDKIFAAIGDGISALSNLYFTTQYAPNMYNHKNSMSEAMRVRYDKMIKEREGKNAEYYNGLMRARQADKENEHRERAWRHQLGIEEEARNRYKEGVNYRNERDKIADDRYKAEQADKKAREEEEKMRWQKTFDENKRRGDRAHNLAVKQHEDNMKARKEAAKAYSANGVRGKQLGFADGAGNQVSVYENVWRGSMQQVYDAMLDDLAPSDEAGRKRFEREMRKLDTPQKKDDYVKQNWHKSPKASQIMLTLSSIDPATMTSEVNNSDVEDYVPSGSEEVIDYIPGK